ncbi:hypothetical protein CAC42_5445 [Sphaceloma murrayae]|uniref:Uncharacterized protein n=1 Tax=Sphaceloma murrayae TaxID=2082308 RepID=A0A2K1QV19_9PEZI|nr:hypothetical protein CAC42_5445 [Sphaceloma murrayae]
MAKFHVKRTPSAHKDELSQWNGARSTRWVTPPDGKSVLEIQTTHTPHVFKDVPDEKNVLIPPYHWHWYQEEQFYVREGRYLFTLESRTFSVDSSSPQPIAIPPGARHTFRADPTSPSPCTIEISTLDSPHQSSSSSSSSATTLGASERFFRNIYSYLEDCTTQNIAPSLPQLLLMLHDAEISLAFPGPAGLARWASWLFGFVGGKVVGEWCLGYRSSYPEYYDPERKTVGGTGTGAGTGTGTGMGIEREGKGEVRQRAAGREEL